MTFKTFFYCDKCGKEGEQETKYAEWVILSNITYNRPSEHERDQIDLCKECHEKVIKYAKEKEEQ